MKQASFGTSFAYGEYDGYKAYLTFDNSKVGGKAITKNTEMINGINNLEVEEEAKTTTLFAIDGVIYEPVEEGGTRLINTLKKKDALMRILSLFLTVCY